MPLHFPLLPAGFLILNILSATGCQGPAELPGLAVIATDKEEGTVAPTTLAPTPLSRPASSDQPAAANPPAPVSASTPRDLNDLTIGLVTGTPLPGETGSPPQQVRVPSAGESEPIAENQPSKGLSIESLPVAPRVHLSAPAQRLKQLLDDGKWNAASTLLDNFLQIHPDDGGVHAMHGRFLLNQKDTLHDYIPADSETGIVLQAFRNAIEFAPEMKPLVADILLRHAHTILSEAATNATPATLVDLYLLAEQQLEASRAEMEQAEQQGNLGKLGEFMEVAGIVTIGNLIAADRGHLYIAGGWDHGIMLARECDPQIALNWSPHLAQLGPKFAAQGLFGSGMYMRSAATWLTGTSDKKSRVLECLSVLVDQADAISKDAVLRKRADISLGQLIKAGWETEVRQLVEEQNPVAVKLFNTILQK